MQEILLKIKDNLKEDYQKAFNPITPGLFWRLNPWGRDGVQSAPPLPPPITQERNMET